MSSTFPNPIIPPAERGAAAEFSSNTINLLHPGDKDLLQESAIPAVLGRFVLEIEIGQGAFGRVWRAHDPVLDRRVALKIAKYESLNELDELERFRREARNASHLQHPNIVTVFDSGVIEQRWYMASAYIEGRTLGQLLTSLPPGKRLPLAQVATIVRKLAEALAYAHKSGIVHRDIKPSNIMIRDDGEPMILDFGLAMRSSDVRMTHQGQVLGTPAYMAPEQWLQNAAPASDQYSLGVLLYELLTGQLPFITHDIRLLATLHFDLPAPSPRSTVKDLPVELETICLKCLAKEPSRRYADCQELADDLRRWQEGEPIKGRKPSLVERLSLWSKRNPLLAFLILAVALLLILGTSVSSYLAVRAMQAEAATEQQLQETLRAKEQASQRYELAAQAFHDMVFGIQNQLEQRHGTQELRKDLLSKAREGLAKLLQETQSDKAPDVLLVVAHLRMGDVELGLGQTMAAKAEYEKAMELAKELLRKDPDNAKIRREIGVGCQKLGEVCELQGQTAQALELYQETLGHFGSLTEAIYPRDLCVSYTKLGNVCLVLGKTQEAQSYFEKLLESSLKLSQADPKSYEASRDLGLAYERLGDVLLLRNQPKDALDFFRQSLQIHSRLAEESPKNFRTQRDLSVLYIRLGDTAKLLLQHKDALVHFEKCLEVRRRLAARDPDDALAMRELSLAHVCVADGSLQLGKSGPAREHYLKSLEIAKSLAKDDPNNLSHQRDLTIALSKLGELDAKLGNASSAIELLQQSLEIVKKLAQADPKNARVQRDLALHLGRIGDLCLTQKRIGEALESHRASEQVRLQLLKIDPHNPRAQRELAVCYGRLAEVQKQAGKLTEAIEYAKKNVAIREQLALKNPRDYQTQGECLGAHFRLANLLQEQFRFVEALDQQEKALAITRQFKRPAFALEEKVLSKSRSQCQIAKRASEEEEFVFAQKPDEVRRLLGLRMGALLQAKNVREALATTQRYARWLEEQKAPAEHRYQAALYFASCAQQASDDSKEAILQKCIAILAKLQAEGYFTGRNIDRLDKDVEAIGAEPSLRTFRKNLAR